MAYKRFVVIVALLNRALGFPYLRCKSANMLHAFLMHFKLKIMQIKQAVKIRVKII